MDPRTAYNNLPIRYKLRLIVMTTVSVALAVAGATLVAYDQIAARASMKNDLNVLAEIFSANSTAALSFSDHSAADELLATLRARTHITSAFIYTPDGKLFARYLRS